MPNDPSDRFRLTTYRGGRVTRRRRGLHLLRIPDIGGPLVMYSSVDRRRIVTSPVLRVLRDLFVGGIYFETRNSLYLVEYDSG